MASSRLERIGTIYSRLKLNVNMENLKRGTRRQRSPETSKADEDTGMLISMYAAHAKKKRCEDTFDPKESRQKVLDLLGKQSEARVEGLITRGAMRPDDRPLWFDVYRRFPPIAEPKFARPRPETKPLRQILYPEDAIRAKFHGQGHGLGSVNMLNPVGDTHIKKLVQQYEKLKEEGAPERELVEKSVAAIGQERAHDTAKIAARKPGSATVQVLAEADLKNIFNS